MNYFTHAYAFLETEDAHFVAGTGVPDWLSVADRDVRIRWKHAEVFSEDSDGRTASVARGVMQHLEDDARFHRSRDFVELCLDLTVLARDVLDGDSGLRPGLLGHLLVEVLLDASLIAEDPGRLEAYYDLLETVDGRQIQQAVNRMAPQPTERLAAMIGHYCQERILWDYLEDGKLFVRLNQVMRRVNVAQLPDRFQEVLPEARHRVDCRKDQLIDFRNDFQKGTIPKYES